MTSTGVGPGAAKDASDPVRASPGAVRRSETLRQRAGAARGAASLEAAARVASARDEAAAIRAASEARVTRVLSDVEEEARAIVAAAEEEAARLVALARQRAAATTPFPQPAPRVASTRVAWGLVAGLVVGTVAIVLGQGGPLALAVVVAVSAVCPGLGVVLALGRAAGPDRAVTTVLLSVCWSGAVALTAAWTTVQQPMLQYGALVAPALVGAAIAIGRGRASSPAPPMRSRRRGSVASRAGWLLLLASAAAYVFSLVTTRARPVGEYGLLPVLGPWFAGAVALAVATVVVACLLRPVSVRLAASGLFAVAFLFMPPRVLVDHNLLAGWAYKHLGVVDLIVQVLSGADLLPYANLAQPLLVAMAATGLAVAVHRLFGDTLAAVLAALLFSCTMWAGQFYFSPQTLCFGLTMLCLAHVVTLLRSLPQDRLRGGWFGRRCGWALRDLPPPQPLDPAGRRVLVATVVATYLLIVVSHQITPYVLVLQLAPAALTGWLVGRWRRGYLVLAALPVLWLYLHREVLGTNNTALTGFSFANAQSLVTGPSSDAQELAATAARVVAVLVLGGGAAAALSYYRRLGVVLLPVVLGVMPAFVLLAGNYGGEAPYRVWLFASPWFCALIAKRVRDLAHRRAAAIVAVGALSVGTFLASAQATSFGMYPFLRVSDEEVAASRWLAEETPPGSTIVHLTRTFPGRVSAGYTLRNPLHTINDPALIDYPQFEREHLVDLSASELRGAFVAEFGPGAHLVVARGMEQEARYYGALPEGAVLELAEALAASPSWAVVYANSEVFVFVPR